MNKEEMKRMLPLIKEWVENEDAQIWINGYAAPDLCFNDYPESYKIVYPKKTIIVNGVEVPAPEKKGLEFNTTYFVPDLIVIRKGGYMEWNWIDHAIDYYNLENGLIYLNEEDAIARAKAMLLFKEK